MKKKKSLVVFLLVIMIFSACSSEEVEMGTLSEQTLNEEKKTELSLFYSGENINWIAAMEELCETFMSLHPDIFEIDNIEMFEKAGKLGVLDETISSLVENPVIIDNETYALPFYSTSYGIVYNKVLFKKYGLSIPRTYEEFLQVCEFLENKGIAPLAVGGSEHSAAIGWMNYFFLTQVEKNNKEIHQYRICSGKELFLFCL